MLNIKKYIYPTSYNSFGVDRVIYELPKEYEPKRYNHVCRYSNINRLYDDKFSIYYHEFGSKFEIPESDNDEFHKVLLKEENRLDIISNNYYGTPLYWWIIAAANNIQDAFEVPMNTVLRIPPLAILFDVGGILQ